MERGTGRSSPSQGAWRAGLVGLGLLGAMALALWLVRLLGGGC